MLLLTSIIGVASVSASEITYKNVITDETTIEEDFKLLGLDVNDYYLPKKYEYQKWYVVALSETYIDENTIQTYLYMYNPYLYDVENVYFPELTFFYDLNGVENTYKVDECLNYDLSRSLYKVKGFTFDYTQKAIININRIWSFYDGILDEEGNYEISESYNSDSTFSATTQHSKVNKESLDIELNFNSTLIIEEFNVYKQHITQEDNFINNWDSFWNGEVEGLDLWFYNFNFPDRIEYDSVEYAKFRYDYNYLEGENIYVFEDGLYGDLVKNENASWSKIVSVEKDIIREYSNKINDGKNVVRVNDTSMELNFDTFVLGNRVLKGEFSNFEVSDEITKAFNYDCSILLDSTYTYAKEHTKLGYITYELSFTELDDIEFLELHYMNDGILYKCQVVVPPVDSEDVEDLPPLDEFEKPDDEDNFWLNLWNKFKKWFISNIPESIIMCALIVIGAPVIVSLLVPLIISLLRMILKWLINLIKMMFILPFKIIKLIFKKKRYRGDKREKW